MVFLPKKINNCSKFEFSPNQIHRKGVFYFWKLHCICSALCAVELEKQDVQKLITNAGLSTRERSFLCLEIFSFSYASSLLCLEGFKKIVLGFHLKLVTNWGFSFGFVVHFNTRLFVQTDKKYLNIWRKPPQMSF